VKLSFQFWNEFRPFGARVGFLPAQVFPFATAWYHRVNITM
jgi:hypothetical protein